MTVAPALKQVEFRSSGGPRVAPAPTRRRSAGIRPAAGATSSLPSWWSAEDWETEVGETLAGSLDVCRAHHVQADTVLAVARGMAYYADHRTGRDCRPTNDRLVEALRVSLSTVQRARRVLKALGLVVELVAGRSIMTRAERLAAHANGSSHRQIAAEFALCSRRQRPATERVLVRRSRPRGRRRAVDGDTPPGSPTESQSSHLRSTHLRATTERRKAAPRPAPTEKVGQRRPGRPDPATRRLAEAIRGRLGWLSGVSARRLTPTLHRFAQAGWTPRDVERAVVDAMATRGWRLPRHIAHPAAYLATLLRALDPEDRPGALDDHMAAVDAAQRAYERLLVFGAPCTHGQPAGDVPSPLRGHLACPSCRARS